MNDFFQLIILSIVQGITEFLPISSSAHLIILPKLFNWNDQGLLLDVSMHFGSLLAVSVFFVKNSNEFRNLRTSKHYINFKKILLGSVPVIFFGYVFHDYIESNLRSIGIIAILTILVAVLILFAEFFKKNTKTLSVINNFDMFIIGIMQAFALIPGTSRAGIIILAALLLGYDKKSSIVIALVLSFPVIFLAMMYLFALSLKSFLFLKLILTYGLNFWYIKFSS